ncbi:AI-2E family transporter [Fulvivirga lutea]|uniref:AI-2E family transporter n=1 Tax=Fulvivirga lutea TaxID=2810512 RepID=A0A974WGQ8_9BACT|nr:AI-2E family transporter [Fulvivirga lutea]QSE96892.1 AI-2E family transporter [Fulvivirga lutea]
MRNTIIYILLFAALFILAGWIFSDIFLYVAFSIVLSAILRPLMRYLTTAQFFGLRLPRLVAVILSFGILVALLVSFFILFIPLISEQVEVLSSLNYDDLYQKLTIPLQNLETFMIANELTSQEPGFIVNNLKTNILNLLSEIQFSNILNAIIALTGKFFIGILAVTFISFFLLYEMGSMRKKLISFIPNKYFEVTITAYNKIEKLLSNYLTGLLIQMFSVFSLAALGLSIVGVKYSLTIALFAAVANLIPYLGPILGASFGIIVGISTGIDLTNFQEVIFLILKIVSVFAGVQVVDNVFLQPIIFSKSVKAHPLEIFIIIFAGASLAGIPGMVAAIPCYTVLRVSFTELYEGYRSYKIFKTQKNTI